LSSEFFDLAATSDVPSGTMKAFDIAGRKIVVYHTESGYFASDNDCPHRGGPLIEGDLIGNEVICPWHVWAFDVVSGCNDRFPEKRLVCHQVKIEGQRILVRLAQELP
jgi:nitrite reductase (NADH) small subunit